jgi:hypothetical protein
MALINPHFHRRLAKRWECLGTKPVSRLDSNWFLVRADLRASTVRWAMSSAILSALKDFTIYKESEKVELVTISFTI